MKSFVVVILLFLFLFIGCSNEKERLLGKWHLVSYDRGNVWEETLELFEDGTFQSVTNDDIITGKWHWVDSKHIGLETYGKGGSAGIAVDEFRFEVEQLVLVDAKGATYRYEKVVNQKAVEK